MKQINPPINKILFSTHNSLNFPHITKFKKSKFKKQVYINSIFSPIYHSNINIYLIVSKHINSISSIYSQSVLIDKVFISITKKRESIA